MPKSKQARTKTKHITKKIKRTKCIVSGCGGKYLAKGYCSRHYYQIRSYGRIKDDPVKTKSNACIIVGCSKKQCAHYLCSEHHQYYLLTYIHEGKTWSDVDKIIAESNRNSLAKRDRLAIIIARHEIIKKERDEYFSKLAAKDKFDGFFDQQDEDGELSVDPDDLEIDEVEEDSVADNGGT